MKIPSVVNSNSDGSCPLCGQPSLLKFLKSESSTKPLLRVISNRLSTDNRLKTAQRPGMHGSSFSLSVCKSPGLASWLVEPSADTNSHPMLSEMNVLDRVVMSNHFLGYLLNFKNT